MKTSRRRNSRCEVATDKFEDVSLEVQHDGGKFRGRLLDEFDVWLGANLGERMVAFVRTSILDKLMFLCAENGERRKVARSEASCFVAIVFS